MHDFVVSATPLALSIGRSRPKRLAEMEAYRRGRNPEEVKRYNAAYYLANAERLKERARARYREQRRR